MTLEKTPLTILIEQLQEKADHCKPDGNAMERLARGRYIDAICLAKQLLPEEKNMIKLNHAYYHGEETAEEYFNNNYTQS